MHQNLTVIISDKEVCRQLYACTCVCVCMYTDAYVPIHIYKDQRTLGVFHCHSLPYPLETSLILNLSINVLGLGWQPGSLSDLHYSAPPCFFSSAGVTGAHDQVWHFLNVWSQNPNSNFNACTQNDAATESSPQPRLQSISVFLLLVCIVFPVLFIKIR